MSDNLTAVRAQIADAERAQEAAESDMLKAALCTDLIFEERARVVAAWSGFKREIAALRKLERELLEFGEPFTKPPTS